MSSIEIEDIDMDNSTQTKPSTKAKIECSVCNKTYSGKYNLLYHQRRCHSDKISTPPRKEKKKKMKLSHAKEAKNTLKTSEIRKEILKLLKTQEQHTECLKHVIRLFILNDIEEV